MSAPGVSDVADVIIVGSGPGGVNAAAPLVEAGKRVVMIDFGNEDRHYAPMIPHEAFSTLRRTDPNQHRYFMGDHFEGVGFGGVRVGAQLTPPRAHIMRDATERQPADSGDFAVGMSLAEVEREVIRSTLAREGGNKSRTAEILGIGRKTLHRKIEEYGL